MVQANDLPKAEVRENANLIEAKTEQLVILGFTTETDYVDEAYQSLQRRYCHHRIDAVSQTHKIDHYCQLMVSRYPVNQRESVHVI